jgi:hypothetical protein
MSRQDDVGRSSALRKTATAASISPAAGRSSIKFKPGRKAGDTTVSNSSGRSQPAANRFNSANKPAVSSQQKGKRPSFHKTGSSPKMRRSSASQ